LSLAGFAGSARAAVAVSAPAWRCGIMLGNCRIQTVRKGSAGRGGGTCRKHRLCRICGPPGSGKITAGGHRSLLTVAWAALQCSGEARRADREFGAVLRRHFRLSVLATTGTRSGSPTSARPIQGRAANDEVWHDQGK
jgi:hypothetical protein